MATHAVTRPRRRRRPTSSERGFTLVEVMVSVLLTAIATSGLIGLFMVETRSAGYSRHATEATVLAQDVMEQLRTGTATGTASVSGLDESGQVVAGGMFTRTWTVTAGAGFDEMVVTVDWTEDGKGRTVTLYSKRNPP